MKSLINCLILIFIFLNACSQPVKQSQEFEQEKKGSIKEAISLMENGQVAEGIKILNYNIKNRTDSTSYFYYLKGMGFYKLKDFKKARLTFQSSLEVDSLNHRTYAAIGDVHQKLLGNDSALFFYNKAKQGLGNDPFLLNNMTSLYFQVGENQKAVDISKELFSIDSLNPNYCYSIATGYYKLKDLRSALIYADKTIQLNSKEARAYNLKGLIYLHLENKEQAKEFWLKALEVDPNNKSASNNLKEFIH